MVLHAGHSQSICMVVCSVIVLGVSPGQISVILAGIAVVDEVIIQTLEIWMLVC